jgi:hypothetical protein
MDAGLKSHNEDHQEMAIRLSSTLIALIQTIGMVIQDKIIPNDHHLAILAMMLISIARRRRLISNISMAKINQPVNLETNGLMLLLRSKKITMLRRCEPGKRWMMSQKTTTTRAGWKGKRKRLRWTLCQLHKGLWKK